MRLCGISSRFQLLSPSTRQVTHALLTRPPLTFQSLGFMKSPFDLHVLGTPPAFILSQDQTLMLIVVWTCQNFFWHSYLCLDSSLNFSLLPSFRSSAFGIFRVALLFICQGTRLSLAQSIELRSNHWTKLNRKNFRFCHWKLSSSIVRNFVSRTEKEGFEPSRRY